MTIQIKVDWKLFWFFIPSCKVTALQAIHQMYRDRERAGQKKERRRRKKKKKGRRLWRLFSFSFLCRHSLPRRLWRFLRVHPCHSLQFFTFEAHRQDLTPNSVTFPNKRDDNGWFLHGIGEISLCQACLFQRVFARWGGIENREKIK